MRTYTDGPFARACSKIGYHPDHKAFAGSGAFIVITNILNTPDRNGSVKRISKLQQSAQLMWGSMTAAEMLWHLRSQLELALGITVQTTGAETYLSPPPLRWLALYIISWPKGSRTAPEMNVKKLNPAVKELSTEKALLLKRLEEVIAANDLNPHPLFGKMNKQLWGRLIWKSFDHHLRQFGL